MLIGDIFERKVTRDINPVVYFHEQSPEKLAQEVSEYIITGGYDGPDLRANSEGIHEQFVRLLKGICGELGKPSGPEHPAAWISGFYGSGKSSFAKLFGLALNGTRLPDGAQLSEVLLKRDESPNRADFHEAWRALIEKIKPMAVVFDIGSVARDDEHIHAAVVRECQKAMGYCSTSALVADHELKLEVDKQYVSFLSHAKAVLGRPWSEVKDQQLAEDHFSAVLHALSPNLYSDPMAWIDANAGRKSSRSADDSVRAIEHMLGARYPGRSLFLVVDEVSQYVSQHNDRMLALQSFVSALGQRLKGKVWLLATGQQKLEEGASATSELGKLKDRFPAHLRVHLSSANIRDVVHQRLLKKKYTVRAELEELYRDHQPDLALYAYQGDRLSLQDFLDVYPLLPGHIDLLMAITTGLRARSSRVQGDSHAIRGLLQLLGDLFREQDLTRRELGTLITLDRIWEVLHTALDADVQMTLHRAFDFCKKSPERLPDAELAKRVLKAVSLLELIQDERTQTDAELIGRCLYERVGQGSNRDAIQAALEALRAASFVDYSVKAGFKVQSSAGQEWTKEREKITWAAERISTEVQKALHWAVSNVDKAELSGMGLPWHAWFSDSVGVADAVVKAERSPTRMEVDFRFVTGAEAKRDIWVPESDSLTLRNRVLWIAGDIEVARQAAIDFIRSDKMVDRYDGIEATLLPDKRRLLQEERNRKEDAEKALRGAVEKAFLTGAFYFRGKAALATDEGTSFGAALKSFGDRAVAWLYPNPVTFRVTDSELKFLIESADLAGPPPVFGEQRLGLLIQDSGRYEASCTGSVPSEILRYIDTNSGVTGSTLLTRFGGPPHGLSSDIVRACVLGLMRGHKLRVRVTGLGELTSAREEGARELLKDQTLRKAEFFVNKEETISGRDRNAICALFLEQFQVEVPRDDDEIANAVTLHFSAARERLTEVQSLLVRLPGKPEPEALRRLDKALESTRRQVRHLDPTLKALKRHLSDLRDGLTELRRLQTDLTVEAVQQVQQAYDFSRIFLEQLEGEAAAGRLTEAAFEPAAVQLQELLSVDRPWEVVAPLTESTSLLRRIYETRRASMLRDQEARIEGALERLKLREGFDVLSQDDQHSVLRHLREGAPFATTVQSPVPPLSELQSQFPERLRRAEEKALGQLDELRERHGELPTATVVLELSGREIDSEAALERFLGELRAQLLQELRAGHRIRLK